MKRSDKHIIFLVSLPRSGSTLLQRILNAHSEIHSTAESWILLPQFYAMRAGSVFSEYVHTTAAWAIRDFCDQLPGGKADYYRRSSECAVNLFADATPPDKNYFLEKTPRNNLIIDELISAFPGSRFVFLWRNPLACAASLIETFGNGRWNLYKSVVDLYDGLDNMTNALRNHGDRITSVRYEDLILNPDKVTNDLLSALNLAYEDELTTNFASIHYQSRVGDKSGVIRYSSLDSEPLHKWKRTLSPIARNIWARRYLRWIGPERISVMGYDYDELTTELEQVPRSLRGTGSDLFRMCYGTLERVLQLKIFRHMIRTRGSGRHFRRYI